MSNNVVNFRVGGNEVLAFMDQVKKKGDQMTAEMIENAKKQSTSARDQVKSVEDQIKALEKRNKLETEASRINVTNRKTERDAQIRADYDTQVNAAKNDKSLNTWQRGGKITDAREVMEDKLSQSDKQSKDELRTLRDQERNQNLQTKLMKENIDTIKSTSNQELSQMRKNNSELVDEIDESADPQRALAQQVAKERYSDEDDKPESMGKQFGGALLNVGNLQALMGSMGQFGSSQNGFDMVAPASKGVGNIIGTILGAVIGGIATGGAGALVGAGIGGQIGGMFGDTVGQFEQRRLMETQDFLGAKNKLEATTQGTIGAVSDDSAIGVSVTEYLTILRQIAQNTANGANASQNAADVLEMDKALGVGRDVTGQMINYFRGTNKDISNLVSGVMSKGANGLFQGGDYTFLNEFLQKFNSLHSELRNSSEKVATGTTFDILNTFNKMGGQFSSRDQRSSGLISGINSSLANPGSDTTSAISFLALRKANPSMSLSDLIEERQKGLGSSTYLKSMMQYINAMGGDRSTKIRNTAGMFGLEGNMAAARRLYDNRGKIGNMSTEEIEDKYTGNFRSAAEGKTTVIEQNMAGIKNGLLGTWSDGVDAMVEGFTNAMQEAFKDAVITLPGNGTIVFNSMRSNSAPTNKASQKSAPVAEETNGAQFAPGGSYWKNHSY